MWLPGPLAPPATRRPSLKITARSYSWTTCRRSKTRVLIRETLNHPFTVKMSIHPIYIWLYIYRQVCLASVDVCVRLSPLLLTINPFLACLIQLQLIKARPLYPDFSQAISPMMLASCHFYKMFFSAAWCNCLSACSSSLSLLYLLKIFKESGTYSAAGRLRVFRNWVLPRRVSNRHTPDATWLVVRLLFWRESAST